MNLMPLANLLEDGGVGTKGTTIFLDMMPAEADSAILLRTPLRGSKIDYELPGYFKTEYQLIIRTPSSLYDDAMSLTDQVIATLTLTNAQVENHYYTYSRPRTEAIVFPLSKGNLLEFNVMFDCCFVKTP